MNFAKPKLRFLIPILLVLIFGAIFGPRYIHDSVYERLILDAKAERDGNFPSRDIEKGFYLKALKEARAWNDPTQISDCLCALGMIAFYDGDYNKSVALLGEALQIDQTLTDRERDIEFLNSEIAKINNMISEKKTEGRDDKLQQ